MPTFRDADGLWEGHRVEDVATPEAYERQPAVVHRFYDARRAALAACRAQPRPPRAGAARGARSATTCSWSPRTSTTCTSAPARTRVLHMHGELRSALCRACGGRVAWAGDLGDFPPCPRCGTTELRPDVVWFGEIPYEMDRIFAALEEADLFVSIGTSGAVYPAAGFVQAAPAYGARTLELNLVPSEGSHLFDEARHGPAGELVPAWVDELLG